MLIQISNYIENFFSNLRMALTHMYSHSVFVYFMSARDIDNESADPQS